MEVSIESVKWGIFGTGNIIGIYNILAATFMKNILNGEKMSKYSVLKQVFGYDEFRNGQGEIVDAIMSGRDVLGIMPTGAGKSICYQLPALMLNGITIVVSPLISLMIDQVKALNEAGIHAAYINSALSENQITKALYNAMMGQYKIIYVAPERLETNRFLEFVMNAEISMVTIDEAHCISQWGQDFRPSYLKIVNFIKRLPKRPIVSAFTATATNQVKDDIVCILGLTNPFEITTGFDRPNLYFEVKSSASKDREILEYIQKHKEESGIIYCNTRKNVEKLYDFLMKSGIAVLKYHAGMDNDKRKKNQEDFIYDRVGIIIATNAFGMGIDKSNVRFVIHYNMPQCIENYYQEAGRAGRDGEASDCILYYNAQDVRINEFMIEKKGENKEFSEEDLEVIQANDRIRLKKMRLYTQTNDCLREYMLNYFGEYTYKKECGNCSNCMATYENKDVSEICQHIIKCIEETKQRYGAVVITGILKGHNTVRLRSYNVDKFDSWGKLLNVEEQFIKSVINELISKEYINESEDMYRILKLTRKSTEILDENVQIMIKWSDKKAKVKETKIKKNKELVELNSRGKTLFVILKELRKSIAMEENVPPYIIFSDKTLVDMCRKLPFTKEEMLEVNGVGERKYSKYGDRFIESILNFTNMNKEKTYF